MKPIILLGAGIAAYFLLGGSSSLGGGASGSGGKKATAITGIVQPGQPGTNPPDSGSTPPSYNTTVPGYGNIATPFVPSPYLVGLIAQKYATNPPPVTKKEAIYEAGTQAMFKGFNYPDMTKTSGGYGYTDQQIYSPTKDIGTGVLNERLNQVIVAPQSYVDSVSTPTKKDIVAVPYYSFGVGGIGLNTNSGFTPINTPVATTTTKKTTTTTTSTPAPTRINSTVTNYAPKYSNAKYGGWGG
jgi:hypothetical protein